MNERILVVDDDADTSRMLIAFLKEQGYVPDAARTAQEALALIRSMVPDVVLLDVVLPDGNGLDLLKQHFVSEIGHYRVIMLTAQGSRKDALEAVSAGAYDYLVKPISLQHLRIAIRNCLQLQELAQELVEISGEGAVSSLRDIVGISAPITSLIEHIKRIAAFDVPVLILGESGTGKELIARTIHTLSLRRKGPFVPIDCGALPDTLVESEIFGYERGAFSGATQAKPGKLERADGGTFFLDEIGNIPLLIQPKLLRVLQDQSVERLGARQATQVNVRVLSATNADMERLIEEGRFRMDLFHRLNTVVIRVPPLRERQGDIPLLAHYALMKANRAYKLAVAGISPEAMARLQAYSWPGNVRELENCIRSSVIMAGNVLEPEHLPPHIRASGEPLAGPSDRPVIRSGDSLAQIRRRGAEEAERNAIVATLQDANGNKAEAARRLKVDYKSFYLKLRYYGFQVSPRSQRSKKNRTPPTR